MRRLFSLLVLFVVVVVGLVPTSSVPVKAQGNYTIDIDGWCRSVGYVGVVLVENTAYGWKCDDGNGNYIGMSLYDVCYWQYGGGTPVYVDFNDPYSWYCDGVPASQPPVIEQPPSQPTYEIYQVWREGSLNNGNGCSINSFNFYVDSRYHMEIRSNCGTVRFEIIDVNSGRIWYKAEIGSTNQIESFPTSEIPDGVYQFCGVARGNGGWENADHECREVTVGAGSPEVSDNSPESQAEYVSIWRDGTYSGPDCRISRFSMDPDRSSYSLGTNITLDGSSNCSTVRYEVINVDTTQIWYKAEIGAGNRSETLRTGEFPAGLYNVCFVGHRSNWYNASHWCETVGFGVSYSPQADEINSNDNPSSNDPDSGVSQPTQSSDSNNDEWVVPIHSGAACMAPEPVGVGFRARVKFDPPYANNIRSGPGESYRDLGDIQPGEEFTVVGGPECAGGLRWWEVCTDASTCGWTADGDDQIYWIETVSTSTVDPNQLPSNFDLDPACQAVPSGQLSSRSTSTAQTCVASALENYVSEDDAWNMVSYMWDCGIKFGLEVLMFVGLTSQTGNPVLAANQSFTPDNVADCVNTVIDSFDFGSN